MAHIHSLLKVINANAYESTMVASMEVGCDHTHRRVTGLLLTFGVWKWFGRGQECNRVGVSRVKHRVGKDLVVVVCAQLAEDAGEADVMEEQSWQGSPTAVLEDNVLHIVLVRLEK